MQTMVSHFRLIPQPACQSRLEIVRVLGPWNEEGGEQIHWEMRSTPFISPLLSNEACMSTGALQNTSTTVTPEMPSPLLAGFHMYRSTTDLQLQARERLLQQIRDCDVMIDLNAVMIARLTMHGGRS
jgi:hypothetical protein